MRTKNFIKTVRSLITETDHQKEFDNYVKWESKKTEQGNRNIDLLAQAVNQAVSKVNKTIDDFSHSIIDCSDRVNEFNSLLPIEGKYELITLISPSRLFMGLADPTFTIPIPEDCQVPPMNMPCNYGGYNSNGVWGIDWYRTVMGGFDVDLSEANDKMHNCPYFVNSSQLKCTANPTNTNCLECNE
jgi:hypothetical protein